MVNHIAYDRRMLLYSIQARRILAACLMREVMLELIREDNGFTNETVTYSYDPWGNMLEKVTHAYGTATPVKTVTYSYGNTDWRDELTGIRTVTGADTVNEQIVYDANGNAVSYRGATLTWNGKQLASWTKDSDSISYAYDENGLRLRKTVNNETTDYYYNGSILMSLVSGDDTLLFSYDQGGNVVSVNYNGTEYYYLRNGQGDIVRLIDSSGTAVVTYGYDSWGRLISCDGSLATTLGTLNPFRYRGYVYDEETGLYYLQSRYYDPEICRFISADVLLSTGQGVLGCNSFAYCNNCPILYVDNSGCRAVALGLLEDPDIEQALNAARKEGASYKAMGAIMKQMEYLGTPYPPAKKRDRKKGQLYLDCSELSYLAYGNDFILQNNHNSAHYQFKYIDSEFSGWYKTVGSDLSNLCPGDLIFWSTDNTRHKIFHVATYIGGGYMIDSTLNKKTNGVSIRRVDVPMYSERYKGKGIIFAYASAPGCELG